MHFESSAKFAEHLDQEDPLASYRDSFHIPDHNGRKVIYFTGNSLGLQPKSTAEFINQELSDWAKLGVEGHFDEEANRPWFHYHKFSKQALGNLVGALDHEVVAMNSLTTNLHLLMVSFFQPKGKRTKILIEKHAFPSDQYAVETQLRFHGLDPNEALIEIGPREGEEILHTADILKTIDEHADELALVLLSGVQYYTGQFFELEKISQAAHDAGAKAGFDLAHAIGNVPLQLHNWGVDFATWCSYKYLNSGPGNVSGIFVHENYAEAVDLPRFGGWWGHNEELRFKMEKGFHPMYGADGWQLSNVNVLSGAAHLAALKLFEKVGISELRKKSIYLTAYCEWLINELNKGDERVRIITPSDPEQRGCQLSLVINEKGKKVFDYLFENGVIADWREPDVIRIAPVPFYNSYRDVYDFTENLKSALDEK